MAKRNQPPVGRFGLEPAPGGLRLGQDLINTALSGLQGDADQDHLADLESANSWLRTALDAWAEAAGEKAPDLALKQKDLAPLRQLRERVRQTQRADAAHVEPAPDNGTGDLADFEVRIALGPDGRVGYGPVAAGWQGVAGLISIELLLAQNTGSLNRLKTCAAPECGACFYDGSPNRSRVWHNTAMCGNAPNLRASRARRKPSEQD
jgi:predicted RNA-binding Zn ribbon-like protein